MKADDLPMNDHRTYETNNYTIITWHLNGKKESAEHEAENRSDCFKFSAKALILLSS